MSGPRSEGSGPDGAGIRARFDDRTPGGGSFELTGLRGTLVATRAEQVLPVLREAEAAARRGCWVAGFVTYEAAAGLDPLLRTTSWPAAHPLADLPLAWFGCFTDRRTVPTRPHPVPADRAAWRPDRDSAWHARSVATIRDDIARGDYYQLNLTARLTGRVDDIDSCYRALDAAQAGAYHGLIVTDEHAIASASPELFVAREGDRVWMQPMKGTAARGRWPAEDRERARELRATPKERAENVMIVDLVRNDLARVARPGQVAVDSLFEVHRFPTVWQLTSTVAATVPTQTGLDGLFAALFPSGSVTGAPKASAMAAIAALEGRPRGVYCGAVGYLAPDPECPPARFNVAIRTVTQDRRTGYAEYGAGGAITHSSHAAAEWAELAAKAAVLTSNPGPSELIETMRFEPPDRLVNVTDHLARIRASADYFDFQRERDDVPALLRGAVAGRAAPGRVRLVRHRSGRVHAAAADLPSGTDPVRLGLAGTPVDSRDVLLYHKHGDRRRYDRHRRSRPDCADVILWNERGEVTETTIATLAVLLAGRWWTPPLRCGLLPGVQRARLIADGRLAERVITIDELPAASALAVVSSLRGWRPATLIASDGVAPPEVPLPDPTGTRR